MVGQDALRLVEALDDALDQEIATSVVADLVSSSPRIVCDPSSTAKMDHVLSFHCL